MQTEQNKILFFQHQYEHYNMGYYRLTSEHNLPNTILMLLHVRVTTSLYLGLKQCFEHCHK